MWASPYRMLQGDRMPDGSLKGHPVRIARAFARFTDVPQIGMTIDWRSNGNPCTAPDAVNIELTDRTPATLLPGALAYALVPYEGIHNGASGNYSTLMYKAPCRGSGARGADNWY